MEIEIKVTSSKQFDEEFRNSVDKLLANSNEEWKLLKLLQMLQGEQNYKKNQGVKSYVTTSLGEEYLVKDEYDERRLEYLEDVISKNFGSIEIAWKKLNEMQKGRIKDIFLDGLLVSIDAQEEYEKYNIGGM